MSTPADLSKQKNEVEAQITSLIAEGEVDDAARLAEEKGLLDKAIVLYEKCSDFRSQGRVYEKLNRLKKAMLAYERGKLYQEAARVAQQLGETRKAERFYNLYQKQEFTPYGH